jgi:hypothetical protein
MIVTVIPRTIIDSLFQTSHGTLKNRRLLPDAIIVLQPKECLQRWRPEEQAALCVADSTSQLHGSAARHERRMSRKKLQVGRHDGIATISTTPK